MRKNNRSGEFWEEKKPVISSIHTYTFYSFLPFLLYFASRYKYIIRCFVDAALVHCVLWRICLLSSRINYYVIQIFSCISKSLSLKKDGHIETKSTCCHLRHDREFLRTATFLSVLWHNQINFGDNHVTFLFLY